MTGKQKTARPLELGLIYTSKEIRAYAASDEVVIISQDEPDFWADGNRTYVVAKVLDGYVHHLKEEEKKPTKQKIILVNKVV